MKLQPEVQDPVILFKINLNKDKTGLLDSPPPSTLELEIQKFPVHVLIGNKWETTESNFIWDKRPQSHPWDPVLKKSPNIIPWMRMINWEVWFTTHLLDICVWEQIIRPCIPCLKHPNKTCLLQNVVWGPRAYFGATRHLIGPLQKTLLFRTSMQITSSTNSTGTCGEDDTSLQESWEYLADLFVHDF